jgi:hypothetical protein
MTRDAATIARLRAQLAAAESAWQHDPRLWPIHAEGYACRRAVENAARKHNLGAAWREVLAARLVVVDVDRDGLRPTMDTARNLVVRWSESGPAVRRVA